MSTPTHVPDRTSPLPCHTPSQANGSTRASTSRPSRGVPVTHLATPPTDHRRARRALWNGSAGPNHLAVMSWRHIYRSITGLLAWDGAQHHYRICRESDVRAPCLMPLSGRYARDRTTLTATPSNSAGLFLLVGYPFHCHVLHGSFEALRRAPWPVFGWLGEAA